MYFKFGFKYMVFEFVILFYGEMFRKEEILGNFRILVFVLDV